MDESQQKEQFSIALARAVAAVAGVSVGSPSVDDDSVDIAFFAGPGTWTVRPRLEAQLKCAGVGVLNEEEFSYALKLKNYDDLRPKQEDLCVPRILIVVRVPADVADWLECSDQELLLRHCAYWISLRGREAVENKNTVSVRIPRNQRFDPSGLEDLMTWVAQGNWP